MKTPVNKQTLRQHLTYSWWKYLLLAALAFGLVDLLYTMTAYRSPDSKKVEFFVYGYADEDGLGKYLENLRLTKMPDQEVMSCQVLLDDGNYGPMQLMTYMAAQEGDVYLLSRDQFLSMASSGALKPLEDDEALMEVFNSRNISLQNGWRKNTDAGETHLYGIPQDKLPGLLSYAYAQNGYVCVMLANGNDENVMKFLRLLCEDMITPPPEAEKPTEEEKAPETEKALEEAKAPEAEKAAEDEKAPEATALQENTSQP